MNNIEIYVLIVLFLFFIWFSMNTIYFYKAEKRKMKQLHRFAKIGEIEAQKKLAKHYLEGNMLIKDEEKAAFWYQKAAFNGDEYAKYSLKKILKNKKNLTKNRYSV